ncbi:MAG: alpha-D-ribose 1-methylphosphonate 5-triphosphate diphosphatase [Chloroflexota bacterium]
MMKPLKKSGSGVNTYIVNANLVLPDQLVSDGSVVIRDGHIEAINPESAPHTKVIDLQGNYLLPGLVDLHCDAIEKDFEARPGVFFPPELAVKAADERNLMAGITTIFQSVAFDNGKGGVRSTERVVSLVHAVSNSHDTRVDNRIHARYEMPHEAGASALLALIDAGEVHLVSLMDHTPQENRSERKAAHMQMIESADIEKTAPSVPDYVDNIVQTVRKQGIPLASHDNDTPELAAFFYEMGANICEFPLNIETAKAAHASGMPTIVGAPNLLRGGSHMGALSAADAISEGAGDIVCSDYASQTLLPALLRLPSLIDIDLPAAVALGTRNPAYAVGLLDRGEIAVGKRADLIGVTQIENWPRLVAAWSAGRCVFRTM